MGFRVEPSLHASKAGMNHSYQYCQCIIYFLLRYYPLNLWILFTNMKFNPLRTVSKICNTPHARDLSLPLRIYTFGHFNMYIKRMQRPSVVSHVIITTNEIFTHIHPYTYLNNMTNSYLMLIPVTNFQLPAHS